jgi:hypothetical protein
MLNRLVYYNVNISPLGVNRWPNNLTNSCCPMAEYYKRMLLSLSVVYHVCLDILLSILPPFFMVKKGSISLLFT